MAAYIIRRLLFVIPTILGMLLVTFVVVQFAPGGPVERVLAVLSGADTGAGSRVPGLRSVRNPTAALRNIVARRGSIRNSSKAWNGSSASTSRRTSASS
jgi:ABC-type microcin C transport system permease subunit YejB